MFFNSIKSNKHQFQSSEAHNLDFCKASLKLHTILREERVAGGMMKILSPVIRIYDESGCAKRIQKGIESLL